MHCDWCKKEIKSNEVFGPIGFCLCYGCEQKRQNPQPLLFEAITVTCAWCGRSVDRYPAFLGDDYFFECEHCGSQTVNIKNPGRPIGPKSQHWQIALESFKEWSPMDQWYAEQIKTDPPIETLYDDPRHNWRQLTIQIKKES